MMDASVIIPAHDAAATLGEQLDALARQETAAAWEILVVDSRSTDGTAALVRARAATSPRLRLLEAHDGRGAGYARNRGAEAARGGRLLFCDADDRVVPGWLEAMRAALATHAIAGGPLVTREINDARDLATRPWLAHLEAGLAPDGFLPWAATANLGVHAALHRRLGGFDEALRAQEDQDYCWRAARLGEALGFAPEAKVHYRLRTDPRGIYRQAALYAEYYPALFRKHRAHGLESAPVPLSAWLKLWGLPRLLLLDYPRARGSRERMAAWALRLGLRVGSLRGTFRFRHPLIL